MSAGTRILLVEDDPAVAAIISELLEDAHFEVDGPYATLSDGVAALARNLPSGAVLDIRLKRGDVDLLADDLDNYAVPYLFCSGAVSQSMLDAHPKARFVSKLSLSAGLVPALRKMVH